MLAGLVRSFRNRDALVEGAIFFVTTWSRAPKFSLHISERACTTFGLPVTVLAEAAAAVADIRKCLRFMSSVYTLAA